MTNSLAETSPAAIPAKRDAIVDFSPVDMQAPFLLRVGSMIIDYMVIILMPVAALIYFRLVGPYSSFISDRTIWFCSILLFLGNIIILPLITRRSLGKLITGLNVVRFDGSTPGIFNTILRQTIGYLLTAGTLGIGFIWCVFSSKGRTLHDIVTGTVVIRGKRRLV